MINPPDVGRAGRRYANHGCKDFDFGASGNCPRAFASAETKTILSDCHLFGTKIDDIAKSDVQLHATSTLRFSGAERIAVLAYGKTTHVTM